MSFLKYGSINALICFLLATGCARSLNPDVDRGTYSGYGNEFSEVRLAAIGFISPEDKGIIQVSSDIVYSSLTFSENNTAEIQLLYSVINQQTRHTDTGEYSFEIKTERELFELSQELFTHREEFEVEPGEYSVSLRVVDKNSGTEFIRQTDAYIPNPESKEVDVTTVRLSGKDLNMAEARFAPLSAYNITSDLDSLKFDLQITNNDPDNPLRVETRLLKFEADLTPSDPMSDQNPSSSEIEFKGINYRNYSVVDDNTRFLDQPGSVLIEYKYPIPEPGNYRFEVSAVDKGEDNNYKAREFAVRNNNFPTLLTPKELAEPLVYLMNESEYKALMEIEDPIHLKNEMDRFWLSNIGSMRRARNVIQLFYNRVETANKTFTNFKEGWKTDRGKIYILFGTPIYIDRIRNRLTWSYTYNPGDPEYNFVFTRNRTQNEFFPFEHYLLTRKNKYHRLEYRQKQLWLSGNIIERRL